MDRTGVFNSSNYCVDIFRVVPFSLHRFKLKRERAEKLFDTRRQEYQSYFKVVESAAKLAGQNYDEFFSKHCRRRRRDFINRAVR